MPGGRLTQRERQQIAQGLGSDLAYAEIARRLGRPTSTITREVMRNGGPAGYRPEVAHRETARRAHGSRRPRTGAGGGTSSGSGRADGSGVRDGRDGRGALPYGRDAATVRAYEEKLTDHLMRSGLPRMTARVLACLYISDAGSVTAAELVRHLEVSAASVSKAVAFLEGQGLVRRERDARRRERYVVDNDVWYQSMVEGARLNLAFAATAREGVGVLGRETAAGVRLENIARFMDFVGESIARSAEQAREVLWATSAEGPEADSRPS